MILKAQVFFLLCPLMSNKVLRSQFYIEIVPSDDYGCISLLIVGPRFWRTLAWNHVIVAGYSQSILKDILSLQTNVALDVIKKDNVSAAIFAPGWVYETKQPPDFQTAQNRYWTYPFCYWCIWPMVPYLTFCMLVFDNSYFLW